MPYIGAQPDKGNFADLNGAKLIIDADADTSLTSDTDDQIDVEVAGADVLQIKSSSGDAVIKAAVDAKDILFQQYDGRTLLDINDGGYVAIANGATGAGQLRLYEDTDNGTNFTAFQVGTQSADLTYTLPTADGSDGHALKTDGSGTLSWGAVAANTPSSADGQALGSASLEWSDLYLADGGVIYFGNDQDIKLTHSADSGLLLKHVATADDKPINLVLQTGETDMAANDVIGKISFQAPDEGTGTDAVLVSAAIQARAEGDHSSSSNASSIDFMTGASEAAATKWSITSAGSFLNAGTNTIDMNAGELILDADQDTSITADTDDQIDIRIAGADDFQFTANTFTVLAGSNITFATSTLTLSSGAVTGTASRHVIAAQSGTTDDFDTLATTNYSAGSLVFITADAGDIIHITNAGNFSETWVLSETEPATFMLIGSTWYQIDRKINANLAENAGFRVAQRGATITSPTGTNITLDRWKYSDQSGVGRVTITQSTTVPNNDFANSLKIDVTTVDSSIAAGEIYRIYQYGLGLSCGHIAAGAAGAKDITISFWWRSDSSDLSYPAIFCGTFGNGNESRVYPFEFSQTTNATWQFHVVTVPGDVTGTWVRTNAKSCYMAINLAVGSNWHGANKTWSAAYDYSTSNQVNGMNHADNDFYLTGYKAELGPIATPFQHRTYAEELDICDLYFQKFDLLDANAVLACMADSSTRCFGGLPTRRVMRATPTCSGSGATDFQVRAGAGWVTTTAENIVGSTNTMIFLDFTTGGSLAQDEAAFVAANGTGKYIHASAEI